MYQNCRQMMSLCGRHYCLKTVLRRSKKSVISNKIKYIIRSIIDLQLQKKKTFLFEIQIYLRCASLQKIIQICSLLLKSYRSIANDSEYRIVAGTVSIISCDRQHPRERGAWRGCASLQESKFFRFSQRMPTSNAFSQRFLVKISLYTPPPNFDSSRGPW